MMSLIRDEPGRMRERAPVAAPALPHALGRLRVALEDSFHRASRELGMSASQAKLLCAALRPAAVGDVARALGCDRSNVSRLVDRAATRGLIRRGTVEADGRVSLVELTTEGEQMARRFLVALESQTEKLRGDWSDQRQRRAVALLSQLADVLEQGAPVHDPGAAPRLSLPLTPTW